MRIRNTFWQPNSVSQTWLSRPLDDLTSTLLLPIHCLHTDSVRLQTGTFTTQRHVHPIPTGRSLVIPHWQLRDLVQSTTYRPQSIFYVNNQVLREVDLTNGKIVRAMGSWEFSPRCISILDDFVMAGSDNGLIQGQSLNRSKDESMKAQISTQINNNICLYTALDGTRRALIGYVPWKRRGKSYR